MTSRTALVSSARPRDIWTVGRMRISFAPARRCAGDPAPAARVRRPALRPPQQWRGDLSWTLVVLARRIDDRQQVDVPPQRQAEDEQIGPETGMQQPQGGTAGEDRSGQPLRRDPHDQRSPVRVVVGEVEHRAAPILRPSLARQAWTQVVSPVCAGSGFADSGLPVATPVRVRTIAAGQSLAKDASAAPPVPRLRTRRTTAVDQRRASRRLPPCRPAASAGVARAAALGHCRDGRQACRGRSSSRSGSRPPGVRHGGRSCFGRARVTSIAFPPVPRSTSTGNCVMASGQAVSKSGAIEMSPHGDIVSLAQGLAR